MGRHQISLSWPDILRDGVTYHDLGADYFDGRKTDKYVQRLVRQLERLGQKVVLQPVA